MCVRVMAESAGGLLVAVANKRSHWGEGTRWHRTPGLQHQQAPPLTPVLHQVDNGQPLVQALQAGTGAGRCRGAGTYATRLQKPHRACPGQPDQAFLQGRLQGLCLLPSCGKPQGACSAPHPLQSGLPKVGGRLRASQQAPPPCGTPAARCPAPPHLAQDVVDLHDLHQLHGDVVLVRPRPRIHLHAGPDAHRRHRQVDHEQVLGPPRQVQQLAVLRWLVD